MPDAKELAAKAIEGMDLPDEQKEKLTGVLESQLKPVFSDYESKITESDNKLKEAIETRQEVKEKLKGLEDKVADGQSELKELLDAKRKEVEDLTSEISELKTGNESLKQTVDSVNEERRTELLEQLPENMRDAFKGVDVSVLSKQVKAVSEALPKKASTDGGKFGKVRTDGRKLSDLSEGEYNKLYESDKTRFKQMYREEHGFEYKE